MIVMCECECCTMSTRWKCLKESRFCIEMVGVSIVDYIKNLIIKWAVLLKRVMNFPCQKYVCVGGMHGVMCVYNVKSGICVSVYVSRCQSVGGFADSLARKNIYTLTHTQFRKRTGSFTAGCHLTLFSGRKNDSQPPFSRISRLYYDFNVDCTGFYTTNSHQCMLCTELILVEVNERSFADKNGWFLIIKSYTSSV